MSKGLQSPGGSVVSESAPQIRFDAEDAASRLGLALACAIDIASLAAECARLADALHRKDADSRGLAAQTLANRIEQLANGVCSALDDMGESPADLHQALHLPADEDPSKMFAGDLAARLLSVAAGVCTAIPEAGQ